MNQTGKRTRKQTGMNRYEVHFVNHAKKSSAKRKKMGWTKAKTTNKKGNK